MIRYFQIWPEVIYGTYTWQNLNYACILVQHLSPWYIFGSYLTRCGISMKVRICVRNVLFHDLSISVKYLVQNRHNGKICSTYIWCVNRWWYMLQILSLFLSKYAVSIFIFYFITYMHTLYMTRRCILCPYLIRYGWCQQNLKYASEMVSIL